MSEYDANRTCEKCGGPSPRVPVCGECEVAERVSNDYEAKLTTLRAELEAVTKDMRNAYDEAAGHEREAAALRAKNERLKADRDAALAAGGVFAKTLHGPATLVQMVETMDRALGGEIAEHQRHHDAEDKLRADHEALLVRVEAAERILAETPENVEAVASEFPLCGVCDCVVDSRCEECIEHAQGLLDTLRARLAATPPAAQPQTEVRHCPRCMAEYPPDARECEGCQDAEGGCPLQDGPPPHEHAAAQPQVTLDRDGVLEWLAQEFDEKARCSFGEEIAQWEFAAKAVRTRKTKPCHQCGKVDNPFCANDIYHVFGALKAHPPASQQPPVTTDGGGDDSRKLSQMEERRFAIRYLQHAAREHRQAAKDHPQIAEVQLARADECGSRAEGLKAAEHIRYTLAVGTASHPPVGTPEGER